MEGGESWVRLKSWDEGLVVGGGVERMGAWYKFCAAVITGRARVRALRRI